MQVQKKTNTKKTKFTTSTTFVHTSLSLSPPFIHASTKKNKYKKTKFTTSTTFVHTSLSLSPPFVHASTTLLPDPKQPALSPPLESLPGKHGTVYDDVTRCMMM